MNNYDDIINLPHHVSKNRPQMSAMARAGQFAPFAALTGHSAAIGETARLTEAPLHLGDGALEELDEKLHFLRTRLNEHPMMTITCFVPDDKKEGGAYQTMEANVKDIDEVNQTLVFCNGQAIAVSSIIDMRFSGEPCDSKL